MNIKLPLIGHMSLQRQIRILFLFMLASLILGGFFVWLMNLSDYFVYFGFVMALLVASSIAFLSSQDACVRAKEADARRVDDVKMKQAQMTQELERDQDTKQINDQNQAAILRLMSELQEIADGDLTVQATVSGDITDAIADSVNYTVEELRGLVGRVASVADQVALASTQAEEVSGALPEQLAHVIEGISQFAQQQTEQQVMSEKSTEQHQHVATIALQVQEGVEQTAQSIRELSGLTQELKTAVSRFRVTV